MVKTPKMRHSKPRREPVTIELEPGSVSRIADAPAAGEPADGHGEAESRPNEAAVADEQAPASQPDMAGNTASGEEPMRAQEADFEPWEHDEAAAAAAVDDASPVKEALEAAEAPTSAAEAPASRPAFEYGFDAQPREPEPAGSMRQTGGNDEETRQSTVTPPPVAPGRSGLGLIAAGVIGGLIALAGAGGLQYAGLLGAPGGVGASDGVDSQIAALKSQIAAIDIGSVNDAAARVDALSTALDQVKADVASLKSASGQAGSTDSGLAALGDKLAALEKTVAALGQGGGAPAVDLGPVNEKLSALDALVKSAGGAATSQAGRLAKLEQSVSQLSAKVDAQAAQPKIALAIAASALKSALDRGAPFAAELDTFAAIVPDAPQIAALRAYADKGVPTRAEIAQETDAAANAMVAAAEPADADAGFFQNLLSSAESLVKVRPIGAVAGAGVPETVARVEVAVSQGDYARALSEYDTLPDLVKAAGADFAGKLKARIEVETQIDALISGAMKA